MPDKDILGCKKGGNDAVIQLKENQKIAYQQAKALMKINKPDSKHAEKKIKKRNRIEQRKAEVFKIPDELKQENTVFELSQCLVKIERKTSIFDTKEKKWKPRNEVSHYISTVILSAKKMAKIIRNHWGIENRNNYIRDVVLKEDYSRIRVNPDIMATFRSFTLNTLQANKSSNIKGDIYCNTLDISKVFKLKGIS